MQSTPSVFVLDINRRTIALTVAILMAVIFLGPNTVYQASYAPQEKSELIAWSMGFPTSPWWSLERTLVNGELSGFNFGVHAFSWSWLFLFASLAAFAVWRRSTPTSEPVGAMH